MVDDLQIIPDRAVYQPVCLAVLTEHCSNRCAWLRGNRSVIPFPQAAGFCVGCSCGLLPWLILRGLIACRVALQYSCRGSPERLRTTDIAYAVRVAVFVRRLFNDRLNDVQPVAIVTGFCCWLLLTVLPGPSVMFHHRFSHIDGQRCVAVASAEPAADRLYT